MLAADAVGTSAADEDADEPATDGGVGARDAWTLGVALHLMLTGRPPASTSREHCEADAEPQARGQAVRGLTAPRHYSHRNRLPARNAHHSLIATLSTSRSLGLSWAEPPQIDVAIGLRLSRSTTSACTLAGCGPFDGDGNMARTDPVERRQTLMRLMAKGWVAKPSIPVRKPLSR